MKAVYALGLAVLAAAAVAAPASAQTEIIQDQGYGYGYPNYNYSYYYPGQAFPSFQYIGYGPPIVLSGWGSPYGGNYLPAVVPGGVFVPQPAYAVSPFAMTQRGLWRPAGAVAGPSRVRYAPAPRRSSDAVDEIRASVRAAHSDSGYTLRWSGAADGIATVEYEFRDAAGKPLETAASGKAPFEVTADVPDAKTVVVTLRRKDGSSASVKLSLADLETAAETKPAEKKPAEKKPADTKPVDKK
jgi:hypothetical protein